MDPNHPLANDISKLPSSLSQFSTMLSLNHFFNFSYPKTSTAPNVNPSLSSNLYSAPDKLPPPLTHYWGIQNGQKTYENSYLPLKKTLHEVYTQFVATESAQYASLSQHPAQQPHHFQQNPNTAQNFPQSLPNMLPSAPNYMSPPNQPQFNNMQLNQHGGPLPPPNPLPSFLFDDQTSHLPPPASHQTPHIDSQNYHPQISPYPPPPLLPPMVVDQNHNNNNNNSSFHVPPPPLPNPAPLPPLQPPPPNMPFQPQMPPANYPVKFPNYPFQDDTIPMPHVYQILRPANHIPNYTAQSNLGSGAFGVVELVTHNTTKKQFALKSFKSEPPHLLNQLGFSLTTLREIQSYQRIQNTHQPSFLWGSEHEGKPLGHKNLLTMETVISDFSLPDTDFIPELPFLQRSEPSWKGKVGVLFEYVPYTLEAVIKCSQVEKHSIAPNSATYNHQRQKHAALLESANKQYDMILANGGQGHDLLEMNNTGVWTLTLDQVQLWSHQLFYGLAHLHSYDIIHRDIKPANILITKNGVVKIADFGLCRHIQPAPSDLTSIVSTLLYRAPELLFIGSNLHNEYFRSPVKTEKFPSYAFPVDIWAAGCVLAEMLIGQPLFEGRFETEQLGKVFQYLGVPKHTDWPRSQFFPLIRMMQPGMKPNIFNTNANSSNNANHTQLISKLNEDLLSVQRIEQTISTGRVLKDMIVEKALKFPTNSSSFDLLLRLLDDIFQYDPNKRPSAHSLSVLLQTPKQPSPFANQPPQCISQEHFRDFYSFAFEMAMHSYLHRGNKSGHNINQHRGQAQGNVMKNRNQNNTNNMGPQTRANAPIDMTLANMTRQAQGQGRDRDRNYQSRPAQPVRLDYGDLE